MRAHNADQIQRMWDQKDMMGIAKMGTGREVAKAHTVLQQGEWVEDLARAALPEQVGRKSKGNTDSDVGLLLLTNKRLVCLTVSLLGRITVKDFTFESIHSLTSKTGLVGGTLLVHTAAGNWEINSIMPVATCTQIANVVRGRIGGPAKVEITNLPAMGGGKPDVTTQLANLAKLRQQGVLSDAEFAAAKAKLLSQL